MAVVLMTAVPVEDPLAERIFHCTECEEDVPNSETLEHAEQVHDASGAEVNSLGFMRSLPLPTRVDAPEPLKDIRPAEGEEIIPDPVVSEEPVSLALPPLEQPDVDAAT